MTKIKLILTFFILFTMSSFCGQVLHSKINSKEFGREWNFTVYLPDGYNQNIETYPVIYLLHGNGDDENAWQIGYDVLDSLIKIGIIPPIIAVTPSGKRGWWVDILRTF